MSHIASEHLQELVDGGQAPAGGFSALLTPHRSLGPQGFIVLMLAIGAVSFGTGIVFLMSGAWPIGNHIARLPRFARNQAT